MASVSRIWSAGLVQVTSCLLLALLVGAVGWTTPTDAQSLRADDTFYLKLGGGLSDYAGDASGPDFGANPNPPNLPGPITGIGDFFDTEKFTDGGPFPYMLSGEVGYHFSPGASLGLGYQFGQYPFVHGRPLTVREDLIGAGGDLGTVRHTAQLIGRYMFGARKWTFSPYLDTGLNLSFGGRTAAVGPLAGVGVDVSLSGRTSVFFETRVNVTLGDEAIDGIDSGGQPDALSALPALGLRYTFSEPAVPPRVVVLDGPAEVQVGESAAFTAQVNESEATRPLTYRWTFGDGRTATGLAPSHVYNQPGTYTVTFTARNEAGTARDSLSVEVLFPARITSLSAAPNPVKEGEPVRFESEAVGASPIDLKWDFGDGEIGTGASPTHIYQEPGQYTARLAASNEDGEDRDSVIIEVERALPAVCETIREFNSVYFDPGSSKISRAAKKKLQENVEVLLKCPDLSVRVEGFAAPNEPNGPALSEARARAVTDFYEAEGVDPSRIETSGEGVIGKRAGKKGDTSGFRRVDTIVLDDAGGGAEKRNKFDSRGQLRGPGGKPRPLTPPRRPHLDGPAEAKEATPGSFSATRSKKETGRPVEHLGFGEGGPESGPTAVHTYDQPETDEAHVSTSEEAGETGQLVTGAARLPSTPARIIAAGAAPSPVAVGTPVQFRRAEKNADQKDAGQTQAEKEWDQWGIVVASMGTEHSAESVVRRYRGRFSAPTLVDVVRATTDQGLRHRVVAGTFEDVDEARQALKDRRKALPSGAWLLRLD